LRKWRYGLYVPAGLADAVAAPLIVVLHGCKQRALNFACASGWTAFADRAAVRLLCPDQRLLALLELVSSVGASGKGELDVVLAMLADVSKCACASSARRSSACARVGASPSAV
jgi:poly(3-hydroxybutyrate) depolymerase